ncbi:MAG TPA: dephospho-CoA kinase [Longimicrobiales bacterium]|nr:dephospho-CoA kinase [Longimicrobiales bacterium]
MLRVGLTGNIASGKSSVARTWARMGAAVIDADILARQAVAPGTPGLDRVRESFGPAVIADGALDRDAMRRIVFSDKAARRRLEAIIHPEVERLRREEEERLRAAGQEIVVHDIPLLFEVGLQDSFDVLVVVDAPPDVRAERLVQHRGVEYEEARRLMGSQMDPGPKRARADHVIENAGTLADLEAEAVRVWAAIRATAGLDEAGSAGAGRLRVDMHIHTRLSFDCLSDPDAVVERALASGLDRLCITDHNEIEAALSLAERYPDRVIPGEEVKTGEGVDIIGLFISEWIPKGTPARETCQRIRDQGGIVYVPHPFAGGKGGGGKILTEVEDLVDAVEGFNARIHDQALNRRAQEWGRARDLPLGAGSDAHTLREVGRAYVEVPPFDMEAGSFVEALRTGQLHGRESSRLVHVASTLAKLVP